MRVLAGNGMKDAALVDTEGRKGRMVPGGRIEGAAVVRPNRVRPAASAECPPANSNPIKNPLQSQGEILALVAMQGIEPRTLRI